MKIASAVFLLALGFLFCPVASADQFAYVDRSICTNALNYVAEGSIVLSYCSQCDGERVEIWKVKEAFVADVQFFDHFQLTLFAQKLFRSKRAYDSGKLTEPVRFTRVPKGQESLTVEGVDLAYLYIQKPDGSFRVLAKEMDLEPLHCAAEIIRLPPAIVRRLKG
jgi:hypothetical protein